MRRRLTPSRAFTLVELILVMSLIAIIAGIVAPSLRGFTIGRTNSYTATQIVSMARYARAQAVNEGQIYRMNFDRDGRSFWLTVQQGGAFTAVSNDFGQHIDLAKGATYSTDIQPTPDGLFVDFQPDGRTTAARIKLTDSLGGIIEVACLSPTENFHVLSRQEASR